MAEKEGYHLKDTDCPLAERLKFFFAKRRISKIIAKLSVNPKNVDILDVGCGHYALMLQFLAPYYRSVTGIDFSVDEDALQAKNVKFFIGEGLATLKNLPDNSYDLVTILSCLEHVTHPVELIREARRVTKINGVVLATSPSWFGKFVLENVVIKFFDKDNANKIQVDTLMTYFSKSQMWQVFRNAGFLATEIPVTSSNLFCSVSAMAKKTC